MVFTRPDDIDDADLSAVLARGWNCDALTLEYLAVGFGSHHWQATTDVSAWFVTVDDLVARRREVDETTAEVRERLVAALSTAADLSEAGYDFVVAPLRAGDGRIICTLGDRYVVAVYPIVHGLTYSYGKYEDSAHRNAVVRNVAALHRSPDHCHRHALTETFGIARRADLADAYSQLHVRWESGPFAEPARQLLAQHAAALTRTFATYDALVADVRSQPNRFVLTHGEPHPANTITTETGVVLIDWDTALIAPPERDLWDIIGQEPSAAADYESLTATRVLDDAIEMYRLAWDLSDIAIYISDLRRQHERTDDTSEAWQNLQHFLDPTRW
jgi:thiamine kinase-like enzyme